MYFFSFQYNIFFSHEDIKSLINSHHNLNRVDVSKLLIKNGYVNTVKEAFDNYLNSSYKKIYSTRRGKSYSECIELINNANGIAVLAHPKSLKLSNKEFLILLKDMIL